MIRHTVIRSYKGKFTESIMVDRKVPKGFPADIANVARRKLVAVDSAVALADLAIPPANHLEALKGGLKGKHSIRINDKWRTVFRWTDEGPDEVEMIDYHD